MYLVIYLCGTDDKKTVTALHYIINDFHARSAWDTSLCQQTVCIKADI